MKIAIIQASSQKDKNCIIEKCTKESVNSEENEIMNFGCFPNETKEYTYIQTAFCISILLGSGSVDFVITGCSSGQGMMLACNSLPGIVCGYAENPASAFLFGRINNGHVISFPLGFNFGWAGEVNLKCTLHALFCEPFGVGYPKEDAERKQKDTARLMELRSLTQRGLVEILPQMDSDLLDSFFERKNVFKYVLQNGSNQELIRLLMELKKN